MKTIMKICIIFLVLTLGESLYCEPLNCYQLLEVSKYTATTDEIKKAFRLLARRHHPDRNKLQDTTQLFQKINVAYQILENQYTRKAYDAYLQDPSGSRAYHAYQFYRASYSPQVNPFFVLIMLLILLSWLQWVMRKQMYASAIQSILEGQTFKIRVNQQCAKAGKKGDKRYKQQVAQRLQKQISIEGGYSKPQFKDILIYRVVILPYTLIMGIKSIFRWIWKYYIKRQQYALEDQSQLTRKALKVSKAQWENIPELKRNEFIVRKLWVKQNLKAYRQQMQRKQLQEIKQSNPAKYKRIMNYLRKNQ